MYVVAVGGVGARKSILFSICARQGRSNADVEHVKFFSVFRCKKVDALLQNWTSDKLFGLNY